MPEWINSAGKSILKWTGVLAGGAALGGAIASRNYALAAGIAAIPGVIGAGSAYLKSREYRKASEFLARETAEAGISIEKGYLEGATGYVRGSYSIFLTPEFYKQTEAKKIGTVTHEMGHMAHKTATASRASKGMGDVAFEKEYGGGDIGDEKYTIPWSERPGEFIAEEIRSLYIQKMYDRGILSEKTAGPELKRGYWSRDIQLSRTGRAQAALSAETTTSEEYKMMLKYVEEAKRTPLEGILERSKFRKMHEEFDPTYLQGLYRDNLKVLLERTSLPYSFASAYEKLF